METKVGIVGLGRMGMAMAERFIETGLEVVGTDLNPDTVASAVRNGVKAAQDADEVFRSVNVVVLSLPTADDVRTAVASLLRSGLGRELYIIDTTTSDPNVTRELTALLEVRDVHFLDAPVSGGFFGARAGTLGIMVGGEARYLDHVRNVLDRIGGNIVHMGASGAGHATKLINNLLGATNLVVASELVNLGRHLGLEPDRLIAALNSGSARSSATEISYPRWILSNKFDSGFTMRLMRKDVALANQLVQARGDLPLLAEVSEIWAESKAAVADEADFNKITEFHPNRI